MTLSMPKSRDTSLAVDLVNALEHEKLMNKPARIAQSLARLDLVVFDELGYPSPFLRHSNTCP